MDKSCVFCCKTVKISHCIKIDQDVRKTLVSEMDALYLNSAILQDDSYGCFWCVDRVNKAFAFKQICYEMEECLPVRSLDDVKNVITEERKMEKRLCRLCRGILNNLKTSLTELLKNEDMKAIFQTHFPDINLEAAQYPLICRMCENSLKNFKQLPFVSKFFDTAHTAFQKKTDGGARNGCGFEGYVIGKIEELVMKVEVDTEYGESIKEENSKNIKDEDDETISKVSDAVEVIVKIEAERPMSEDINSDNKGDKDVGTTNELNYPIFDETEDLEGKLKIETEEISFAQLDLELARLENEEIDIKYEEAEIDRLAEDNTDLEKVDLEEHSDTVAHGDQSDVQMCKSKVDIYKCRKCSYETKFRYRLKKHSIVHMDKSEVRMYRCGQCSFETKHGRSLRSHSLKHKYKSEVQKYKCRKCSYKCKRVSTLRMHSLMHKDKSEIQMYNCGECPYKAKFKYELKHHSLVHKDKSKSIFNKLWCKIYEHLNA